MMFTNFNFNVQKYLSGSQVSQIIGGKSEKI
jgi:hypothetical protein